VVDHERQVPSPAGIAWALDLRDVRGALFVILRHSETDARRALVAHLVDIGTVASVGEARALVAIAAAERVGVIW
jgi:hypothetical protein